MPAFLTVIDNLLMIFVLTVVGYISVKAKIIDNIFVDKLSGFLVNIILPLFMIDSLQVQYDHELMKNGIVVIIGCVVTHLAGLVVGIISAKLLKLDDSMKGIWFLSCMFANIGFMGIPVISVVLGKQSVFYCAFAGLAFNITIYTLGILILFKYSSAEHIKIPYKEILFAPVNIGTFIGIILFLCDIRFPSFIGNSVNMIGNTLTPLAMIYVGAVLARTKLTKVFQDKLSYVITIIRLIVMPILGYFMLVPFVENKLVLGVVVIGLATPIGALCAILTNEYGGNVEKITSYIFITTFLSVFTIPFVAVLFIR